MTNFLVVRCTIRSLVLLVMGLTQQQVRLFVKDHFTVDEADSLAPGFTVLSMSGLLAY